jgi:hypothetical protein
MTGTAVEVDLALGKYGLERIHRKCYLWNQERNIGGTHYRQTAAEEGTANWGRIALHESHPTIDKDTGIVSF